jgi:AcrR family transcriptional regulator
MPTPTVRTPTTRTGRRLPAQERERQILHAAIRVFARGNFRAAGTAAIAREAGISEPTIYKYFESKRELFLRLLRRTGEGILGFWRTAAEGDGDARAALRRVGTRYFAAARDHRDELKIQFQALAESDDPEIAAQLRDNHRAYVAFLAGLIERGRRDGTLRTDLDPDAAAWLLNSVGFALTLVYLVGLDREMGEARLSCLVDECISWMSAPDAARSSEEQP